ncbi:MAG: reactive intermediate/imine deaminase [Verrucomicrobiales bacterium]|jgi:reactive intermediate/imine deaminase
MGLKRVLRPAGVWDPSAAGFDHPQPFSQGIVRDAGRMVFVAGQVALDPEGAVIGVGDPAAQTAATLDNLVTVLAEGGATLDDVVRLTVFLTDMDHLPAVQEVRARYFPNDPPVSSTIQISGLVNPELVVEIDAIAVIDATN